MKPTRCLFVGGAANGMLFDVPITRKVWEVAVRRGGRVHLLSELAARRVKFETHTYSERFVLGGVRVFGYTSMTDEQVGQTLVEAYSNAAK